MKRLVGKDLPNFKLQAVTGDGSDFIEVSSNDYKGKWLVLFFYPLDFTFVCPTEILKFSKNIEKFKALNAEILGVSIDSVHSHKAWISSEQDKGGLGKINYPLASDITKSLSKDLGILLEDDGISLRGLFIVDPDGSIKYSVVHDLDIGRSVDETLRVLSALQSGGLCPIDWQPGDKHL